MKDAAIVAAIGHASNIEKMSSSVYIRNLSFAWYIPFEDSDYNVSKVLLEGKESAQYVRAW